ncbi:MAG: hypothetical protein ACYC46_13480 [Acidobacteriaceae bacterium]
MKMGTENKRNRIVAGILVPLALFLVVHLLSSLFGSPDVPVSTPAPVVTGQPAARMGTSARKPQDMSPTQLDPTLHMGAMESAESLVYSGTGRNIFSPDSAPANVAIEKPIASARPMQNVVAVPTGPPPPPPIDLKFFGTETRENGVKRAFLLHGEDVFIAAPGDIVDRRYKVLSILTTGIQVQDMATNNTQTLPLITN